MLKNKFFKNLYQTVSSLGVVAVLEIPIIVGFLYSLQSDENYGWILLIISSIIAFWFLLDISKSNNHQKFYYDCIFR